MIDLSSFNIDAHHKKQVVIKHAGLSLCTNCVFHKPTNTMNSCSILNKLFTDKIILNNELYESIGCVTNTTNYIYVKSLHKTLKNL